ncbi:MTSS1 [Cordylochernes scorpioides]|uniref:MTSS1 n=1 Tax=Cordylochernes scorpioides TaxID=51811 RepID=A0ABY6L580_9ARAC|nr:MTSS1 [Cordylochernes scorpioides]
MLYTICLSSNIQDHLILPLQDRLEEWRKISYQLDKDHAKEFKRVKHEIKKRSSDTLRLQKKAKKGGRGQQRTLDSALQDVNDRYLLLEESERQAVRKALIEERSRFCYFVSFITPVVVTSSLSSGCCCLTSLYETWQTPPNSPPSLGSRKSSMCSISSLNSSSSGSTSSPSHRQPQLPVLRVPSISSQDSGFTSQDHLCTRLAATPPLPGSAPPPPGPASLDFSSPPNATWPNLQDTLQFERAAASILKSQHPRPHTISTGDYTFLTLSGGWKHSIIGTSVKPLCKNSQLYFHSYPFIKVLITGPTFLFVSFEIELFIKSKISICIYSTSSNSSHPLGLYNKYLVVQATFQKDLAVILAQNLHFNSDFHHHDCCSFTMAWNQQDLIVKPPRNIQL